MYLLQFSKRVASRIGVRLLAGALTLVLSAPFAETSSDEGLKTLNHAASALAKAMVEDSFEEIARMMYPPMLIAAGGKDVAIERLRLASAAVRNGGGSIQSVEFESGRPVRVGQQLHAIVKMIARFNAHDGIQPGVLVVRQFQYAISEDRGATWTFLGGPRLTPDVLKRIFPAYTGMPVLPLNEAPVFVPGN